MRPFRLDTATEERRLLAPDPIAWTAHGQRHQRGVPEPLSISAVHLGQVEKDYRKCGARFLRSQVITTIMRLYPLPGVVENPAKSHHPLAIVSCVVTSSCCSSMSLLQAGSARSNRASRCDIVDQRLARNRRKLVGAAADSAGYPEYPIAGVLAINGDGLRRRGEALPTGPRTLYGRCRPGSACRPGHYPCRPQADGEPFSSPSS